MSNDVTIPEETYKFLLNRSELLYNIASTYPCQKCKVETIHGHRCYSCGDDDPSEPFEQEANND